MSIIILILINWWILEFWLTGHVNQWNDAAQNPKTRRHFARQHLLLSDFKGCPILLLIMVKRCCWGTCNTDNRYHDRLVGGIRFIPFPKPGRQLKKAKRWIRLCGRPHNQLNESILNERGKAKHLYVFLKVIFWKCFLLWAK